MALVKGNKNFEMDESDVGADNTETATEERKPTADERVAAAAARKQAEQSKSEAPAEQSASTAVATAAPSGNALVKSMTKANPFTELKNAIHVDYDTLTRIMVTNGNVINKENDQVMGESCVMDLISFQEYSMVAPGGESDDEESLKYVKYSDDGKTERETNRPLAEFVEAAIKAGYDKARIQDRMILVGELVDAGKLQDALGGELVQLDLAPRSVKNFNTHQVNTAFKVAKGRLDAGVATRVKITATLQSKEKRKWTDAEFSLPG